VIAAAAALPLLLAALAAQGKQDFGAAYSFAERKPRTKVEAVIDTLLPSIVKVHGASGLATIEAYATGIIVSKQGHVITLDQIMIQKDRTRVVLWDGSVHLAQLLSDEPKLGVRLLKIDPKEVEGELQPLWPPSEADAKVRNGQFVVSLGNCFRLAEFSEKVSATFGIVVGHANTSLRHRLADVAFDGELILTDACNNPGQYGGGLFTLDGRWIGLNNRLLDSKETNTMVSAAIPSRDLLPYLEEQILGKVREETTVVVKPVYTGIVLFDQPGRSSPPAYVDRAIAGSPGAAVGLRPDDMIVRIDDWSIRTCKEFHEVLKKYQPGQTAKLVYKRGTEVLEGSITFAEEKR
jgi:serine protease Do